MDLALKIVFLVGGSTITVLAITAMVIATVGLYKMVKEG